LQFDLGKFPPYTAGALHILSSDLVYALRSSLPRRYYQNEDQSLGVWLLPFNVTPLHDPRIQQWDVCHSSMIAKHPLTPDRMREMYGNVVRTDDMCTGFDTTRCPLCWQCPPDQAHWSTFGLDCDQYGATVKKTQSNPKSAGVPLEPVMKSVVDYLPYVSCTPRKMEDVQLSTNIVQNGHLLNLPQSQWLKKGAAEFVNEGLSDYRDPTESAIKLTTTPSYHLSFICQELNLNQEEPEAIVISAWSRAEGVDLTDSPGDYSLYADIVYTGMLFLRNAN
jgi:hypothetical protein